MSKINLIYAISVDGFIGKDGAIPWHIPEDFKRFKELTLGHTILMGRHTWDSLPKRPLPGRDNVVLTSSNLPMSALVITDLKAFLTKWKANSTGAELWVIGGEQVYRESLPFADEVYETLVDALVQGDTKGPTCKELNDHGFVPYPGKNWATSVSGVKYAFNKWAKEKIAAYIH